MKYWGIHWDMTPLSQSQNTEVLEYWLEQDTVVLLSREWGTGGTGLDMTSSSRSVHSEVQRGRGCGHKSQHSVQRIQGGGGGHKSKLSIRGVHDSPEAAGRSHDSQHPQNRSCGRLGLGGGGASSLKGVSTLDSSSGSNLHCDSLHDSAKASTLSCSVNSTMLVDCHGFSWSN